MKTTRLFPSFLVTAVMSALLLTAAHADDGEKSSIKFSDPAKPGTMKLTVNSGDIRIHGTDATEVTVQTELKPEGHQQRSDGLRVLTSSSSYTLTEKDNVVSLSYGADSWPGSGGGDFDITVPRNTNIVIANSFGGEITIGQIAGDIEVKSLNGEVKLEDVSGGTSVETMNGEIHANITAMKEGKPLAFTSMNGEVSLTLPSDAKANIRLRTNNGSILTDFDDKQLITKTASLNRHKGSADVNVNVNTDVKVNVDTAQRDAERAAERAQRDAARAARDARHAAQHDDDEHGGAMPIPPIPPLPPMIGGKMVTGTLNGGGPEIRVTTMNGDVTLRKATK
jgi:hypothetical protein